MKHEEMSTLFDALAIDDKVQVRDSGGRLTPYTVTAIKGKTAREVWLVGRCKAVRVLFDDGEALWMRKPSKRNRDGSAHGRVRDIQRDDGGLARAIGHADAVSRHLPPGYSIKTERHGTICHVPMIGDQEIGIRGYGGPIVMWYSDPNDAVIACMQHRLGELASEQRASACLLDDQRKRLASMSERADRAERALRQIDDMFRGGGPTHEPLRTGISPQQVAADVAHRLLVISERRQRVL